MKQLLFGNPGIPLSTNPKNTGNGVKRCRELGLDAMELEFTRVVNVSKEMAPTIKKAAADNNIVLSCHGQYFVNLSSLEKEKISASIKRMTDAAVRVAECGGWSITWHMAFYQGQNKESVYRLVKQGVQEVVENVMSAGHKIWIRPETTGKATQWGDVDECLRLSEEVEQVMPCIDFSHLHARTNGKENTYEEFAATLAKVEKVLGKNALENMHIQVSGIAYTEKGERNHLNLRDSDMNYKDLLKAFKDFRLKGVVVTESPNIEADALLLQKTYRNLK